MGLKRLFVLFLLCGSAIAQQAQSSTAPDYAVSARYVQGVGIGYRPTKGSGLTLNLAKGTANCLGTLVEYSGGTLSLTNGATNYVYLDAASSCAPAFNTSGFAATDIWVAKVVTSGGAITTIDDVRTGFTAPGTGAGTGSVTSVATTSPITGGTITTTGTIACATCTTTIASGAKTLATSAISSATCTSAQTDTATGTASTDAIIVSFNANPTAVTGYVPLTTGMLTIIYYPTTNTVNFIVCNNTSASITPGAVTINWRVVR